MDDKIFEFKKEIEKLMINKEGKITLTEKVYKRNAFLFSVGNTSYLESKIIYENNKYTLFEENINEEILNKVRVLAEKILI